MREEFHHLVSATESADRVLKARDPSTSWPLRLREAATTLRMTIQLTAGHGWLVNMLAGFEGFEALIDFVPVDYVPPGGEIFRTAVVVFQVVGMLPDIVAEDGEDGLA